MATSRTDSIHSQVQLVERALRWSDLCTGWDDEHIAAVREIARLDTYDRGMQVMPHDPRRRELWMVASGCLEISRVSPSGRRFMIGLAGAGMTVAVVRLLDEEDVLPFDYFAHDDSVVVHLPCQPLRQILDAAPILWRNVAQLMLSRYRDNLIVRSDLALGSLAQRTAAMLVTLARMHRVESEGGVILKVRVSQGDLASMLGVTRQSMNKELRAFQERGWIESDSYSRITIRRLQALKEYATSLH